MPSFANEYYIYLNSSDLRFHNKVSIIFVPKIIISKFKKIFKSLKMMESMLRKSIQKIDLNFNLNFEILKININLKEISKFNISFSAPSSIAKDLTKISFKSSRKSIFINDFYTSIRDNKSSKSIYSLIEIKKQLDQFIKSKKDYENFLNEFLIKIYNQQIQNILKNFGFMNYEKNIKQSYQLLLEIFHYSKIYYPRIKSILNGNSFKSKNDLKLIFKNKDFINNVNFDKLNLFNILIIFSLLKSPFNNELNKDEVNSILEFIKNEGKNIDHLERQHIFGKLDVFNFEWIIYCIMEDRFKNNLSKNDLDTCFDIARMKSQFKNYHTISIKYLRKIINKSSDELKKLHDKWLEKINEKEKSKIENIDFNIKNKNIFNNQNLEFEYKLIENSWDLFSLGKYMHNCVYTRLKSIVSNKSLIYQIHYKNKDYCLEVDTSSKDKLSILELKARFNENAPLNLHKLLAKNLNINEK